VVRYRFGPFTLSPQRRLLVRDGREVPLIPRYFDLLVLLIERRHQAVHRREIFERVWADAVVSESALSQAVRTIRSTLGDDSREPRYIRTVSRHGYQFVFPEVIEEDDGHRAASTAVGSAPVDGPVVAAATPSALTGSLGPAAGGALAGVMAGGLGGLILVAAPDSTAPIAIAPVLAAIGAGCGGLGGFGVGAGIALADRAARSHRTAALTAGAALGGAAVGLIVQWLTRWGLSALIGMHVPVGGGEAGVLIGAATGFGLAVSTVRKREDASVQWRWTRARGVLITALCCGLAGLALTLAGRPLAGGTIHAIADAAQGSSVTLAPLGRLIGEPGFGPVSRGVLAVGEAAVFGVGAALGFLRGRGD
jgi:DNA-binding winged helix-turn-helix (wHTH) protein